MRSRGFTLIELLVVIAIIGVLSAIVLASLSTTRSKGSDATTKSQLSQMRAAAELFHDTNPTSTNGSYVVTPGGSTDVCAPGAAIGTTKGIYNLVSAAAKSSGATTIVTTLTSGGGANTVTCHSTTANCNVGVNCNFQDAWAVEAPLRSGSGGFFCVDYTGYSGTSTTSRLGTYIARCY